MNIKKTYAALSDFFARIAPDKKKHFIAGFFIAAFVSLPFGYLFGFCAAVIAGAAKEVYDKATGKGTPELWDFLATVLGAVCFTAISVVLSALSEAILYALY